MSDITFESSVAPYRFSDQLMMRFCGLIHRLGHPPRTTRSDSSKAVVPPEQIFAAWLNHLPRPFPACTGKRLFRLLFPHEGSRRRYGLKETKLSLELQRILGLKGLIRWDSVSYEGFSGTGCLGREVELMLKATVSRILRRKANGQNGERNASRLTLSQVDVLLDSLAASSTFSQLSQMPSSGQTPTQILTLLFRDSALSPYATSVLIQIILRDLRPLLDPLPVLRVRNPTALLRLKSNTGPAQLELLDAMDVWHGRMKGMYLGGMGSLDICADVCEELGDNAVAGPSQGGPTMGVNVPIPKCQKVRSMEYALDEFLSNRRSGPPCSLWAETKYDGYRMQIHVELRDGSPHITIFSKSKRNSTLDRLNTHSIILASLGLPIDPRLPCHALLAQRSGHIAEPSIRTSAILEAEVVPYNEASREGGRGPDIEEFWWLAAAGVSADSDGVKHLCLVFFDILCLDGESLLHTGYDKRRVSLEKAIQTIPGFSSIADRTPIPLNQSRASAVEALQEAFNKSNERRDEGLVLKAGDSTYSQMKWRWVKLKDYIPNLGDCIDLVLLGAGWDQDRARELRVDTSVITTFYLGVLSNAEAVRSRREVPHFEILFSASYGPGREELEVYNENIRLGRWGSKPFDKDDPFKRRLVGLSWTYRLPLGIKTPSLLFERPMCAEVMGAGFQKLAGSNLYELRFPRLLKIYDPLDRPWTSALTASTLLDTAHQALGYAAPEADALPPRSPDSSSLRAIWRSSSTMGVVDIVDTPTPSPTRPTPKRVQSAPDGREILKRSPPTPLFNQRSPKRWRPEAVRTFQQVLGRAESEAVGQREQRAMEEGRRPRTPPTSSPGIKGLRSPIFGRSPPPSAACLKEAASSPAIEVELGQAGPPLPLEQRHTLRNLPTNSLSPARRVLPGSLLDLKASTKRRSPSGARSRGGKALSLRSRMKLAIRSNGVKKL